MGLDDVCLEKCFSGCCHIRNFSYLCIMRKELGKWLMDIAKYITTAVVLTSIFGDVQEQWIIYLGGSFAIVITLLAGLWLVKDKKKGE